MFSQHKFHRCGEVKADSVCRVFPSFVKISLAFAYVLNNNKSPNSKVKQTRDPVTV